MSQSETQPTPGQVIGEDDVAKLRAGDVLLLDAEIITFDLYMALLGDDFPGTAGSHLTFIGRPGPDGFIPWTGGENPVPGQRVHTRFRDGYESLIPTPSEEWEWDHNSPERRMSKGADDIIAFRLSPPAGSPPSSKTEHVAGDAVSGAVALAVWYGEMPESNGRRNWTAVLYPADAKGFDIHSRGFCFARSEYPDRVRYEADRVRWVIGDLSEEPDIMAYDPDLHSGYVAPDAQAAEIADLKARNKALEEGLRP